MPAPLADTGRILALQPDSARVRVPAPPVETPQWRPTRALRRVLALVALALVAAVALGRPDLVGFAVPFLLGTAVAFGRRPGAVPSARLDRDDALPRREGESVSARITVDNPGPEPVTVVVEAETGRWVRLRHGVGRYLKSVPAGGSATVLLSGEVPKWGTHPVGPATVLGLACDGLLYTTLPRLPSVPVRVHPSASGFDSRQGLPNATGMVGIHHSRRPGDGGELAEVRRFQPGDRLRRIDWRVSLRQRDLHVNSTLSERDAEVVLVLDVLHAVGDEDANSLDLAVRAAAAISEHYAHQGDRVGLVEFGPMPRRLRSGTGRRHHIAALEWLSDTRVRPSGPLVPERLLARGRISPQAMVIMLTPLIDQRSTTGLAQLARSGRPLITVDTLPPGAAPQRHGEWTGLATRLWRLERDNTVDRLRELGVPVEPWRGPGSLDQMLAEVARMRRAPKVVSR